MTSLLRNNLLLFGSSSQIIYSHYPSLESESIESKDFVYPHSEEECHHADPCPKPKHAQTDAESVKKSCEGPGFCWICGFDCTWTTPRTNPWKCQWRFIGVGKYLAANCYTGWVVVQNRMQCPQDCSTIPSGSPLELELALPSWLFTTLQSGQQGQWEPAGIYSRLGENHESPQFPVDQLQ